MTQSLFIRRYSNRFLSRWLVLAIDVIIAIFSFLVATALRLNFRYEELHLDVFIYHFVFLLSIRFVTFLYFKTYSGIIRHTSIDDALLI
jgi:FlaA1/EpsC-like NDP-sugar epimerase